MHSAVEWVGKGLSMWPKGCGGTLAMVGDVGVDGSRDDEYGEFWGDG